MEMHQIRYFLAVAETLNFTKAAEQCHVTQPALSRAIQQLENEVGGLLLRRERTLTHLTDLGRLMRPYLEQILRQTEEAKQKAKGFLKLETAELRLGVLNSIGPLNFTGFLGGFHHRHPGIRLVISEGSPARLIELLQQGELEVAIMAQPVAFPERFDVEPLYSERFMVAFPPGHDFAGLEGVRPADMNGRPYVRRLSCEYRAYIADILRDHGTTIDVVYQSEREDWVQSMVMAGLGVSSLPEFSPVLPGLMTRPYLEPAITRNVSLVTVSGRRHGPALSAFVKAVRSYDWPK
ncbi:MAG: LysR family transcriptional regulator [Rhodospirillaceae bacterium]|nr:LysR family transcriptional regulator [Rhodospirillaceae bacterium]